MPIVNTQFPPSISVANLNGVNGFAITGFQANSQGGYSVSGVGDVNADGMADLIIGAPYSFSNNGACYVLFGQSEIGSSGSVNVLNLTGNNGFIITGYGNSLGGFSVSGVGDVNGDGIADLIIGAYGAYTAGGACYVLFGKSGLGSSGSVSVSNLTGDNGFAITGFSAHAMGKRLVSGAGDVNGDGIADLIIGEPTAYSGAGSSYVIFGGSGIGGTGTLAVSNLNGANGFAITGFPVGSSVGSSLGGYSVSGIGDVNNDGIADLMIGAPGAGDSRPYAGTCYVIFGKSGLGSTGMLNVASLTGQDGFTITGFPDKRGGFSVNAAGDVNGDGIADLVAGQVGYASAGAGNGYVVFGHSKIGSLGTLSVSSLIGSNGFAIDGFSTGDQAGYSVTGGDFNGDGFADISIGAPTSSYYVGTSYVILGNFNVGSSGSISVKSLTGQNGFAINGFPSSGHNFGGWSVSSVGDINGDGITDLAVGAIYAFDKAGVGYVIFGDKPGTSISITKNELIINENQVLVFSSQYLNATILNYSTKDPALQFQLSNIQHCRFFASSNRNISLTSFIQQQVRNGQILFAHDGGGWAPSYTVSVGNPDKFVATPPQAAMITFRQSFVLLNNNLIVNQGEKVTLTSSFLSADDLYNSGNNPNLVFSISNVQYGHFAFKISPSTSIISFTQAQVQSESVLFIHDGSINSPSYQVTVINGATSIAPQASRISFDAIPIFIKNTLMVNQGEAVVLTSENLSATNPFDTRANLTFNVNGVQRGLFKSVANPGVVLTSFTQTQIQNGQIQFVPDGSVNIPAYNVSVSDGRTTSAFQKAVITFNTAPVLTNNHLTVIQGQTVTLTSSDLSAIDKETRAELLIFIAETLQHGHFEDASAPGMPTTMFIQQRVMSSREPFSKIRLFENQ